MSKRTRIVIGILLAYVLGVGALTDIFGFEKTRVELRQTVLNDAVSWSSTR